MNRLTDKLRTLRGKAYHTLLKTILDECGQQIVQEARVIIVGSGRLAPVDIGALAIKYDLNFRATCEWLEESQVIPTGVYDRLIERGLRVSEVLAAVSK